MKKILCFLTFSVTHSLWAVTPPAISEPKKDQVFQNDVSEVTVSWLATPDVSNFLIRASDLTDDSMNKDQSKNDSRNTYKGEHYLYIDNFKGSSVSVKVVKNHSYRFWVHSTTSNWSYSNPDSISAASFATFRLDDTYPYYVTLAWDASPDADVKGYKLYEQKNGGVWKLIETLGNVTSARVRYIPGINYRYAATAFVEGDVESVHSDELQFSKPFKFVPDKQALFTVDAWTGGSYELQESKDLKTWQTIANPKPVEKPEFPGSELGTILLKDPSDPQITSDGAFKFFQLKTGTVKAVQKLATPKISASEALESFNRILNPTWKEKFPLLMKYRPGKHPSVKKGAELLTEKK